MLLLWVGTFALTVSPELHHFLHPDSQAPNHNCLITQIRQHLLLVGYVAIAALIPAPVEATAVCRADVQYVPDNDYRVSPSRAPPLLSCAPTVVG